MWKIVFKVNTNTHFTGYCSGAEGEELNFTVGFLLTDDELKEELKKESENFGTIHMPKCAEGGSGYCDAEGGKAEMIKLERLPGLEYDGKINDLTWNASKVLDLFSKPYTSVIFIQGLDEDD